MTLTCETPACKAPARFSLVLTLGPTRVVTRYCYACCPTSDQVQEIASAVLARRPDSLFSASILATTAN
jgi:hypothetical protein